MFGVRQIGRDEIRAFGELCIFVPIVGFSLSMGRVFCGWICPLGFLQEVFGRLSRLKNKRLRESTGKVLDLALIGIIFFATFWLLYLLKPATDFFTENMAVCFSIALLFILPFAVISRKLALRLRNIRYLLLAIWITLGFFVVFVTNPWCILYGGELDYSAMLALLVVLSASLIIPLAWCRYVCPLGTFLSFLTRVSLIRIDGSGKCSNCGKCSDVCITGALKNGKIDPSDCIYCGRCLRECIGELEMNHKQKPIDVNQPAASEVLPDTRGSGGSH